MEFYPINDFGPLMKGMVIGGLGIFHVFTAQFAIGGGMLMFYFQWLANSGRLPVANTFINGYFKFLILLSFVLGALTGVGMWFTSIQVSPRTIGLMVEEFHWVWGIEWTFFCLEVVSGYCFYRYAKFLSGRNKLILLALYSFAAWMSLFWINGILSWQLTPGEWIKNKNIWSGFFNPGFFPSLIFRTVASMAIASLVSCLVINKINVSKKEKTQLINYAAYFLSPMLIMPLLGGWYIWTMPKDSQSWIFGGSVAMSIFLSLSIGSSVLIGMYAMVGLVRQKLFINEFTAGLLLSLAFVATAGGEFVREGVRKPFTIREVLYSNSITKDEIIKFRQVGSLSFDPYAVKEEQFETSSEHPTRNQGYPHFQILQGAQVFRNQCAVCHTLSGVNSVPNLSQAWTEEQKRMNFSKLERLKEFMPPFAGNAAELESLVQFISWVNKGKPKEWKDSRKSPEYNAEISKIHNWINNQE